LKAKSGNQKSIALALNSSATRHRGMHRRIKDSPSKTLLKSPTKDNNKDTKASPREDDKLQYSSRSKNAVNLDL